MMNVSANYNCLVKEEETTTAIGTDSGLTFQGEPANPETHRSVTVKKEQYDNDEGHDGDDKGDESDESDFYRPPEPRYDKANSLNFRQLCHRFETLWKQKSKKKKPSKDEILEFLLPRSLQKFIHGKNELAKESEETMLRSADKAENLQQSIFPLLRLMCPDKDTARPRLYMKEAVIAKTWAEAIGLSNKGSDYHKLMHYNDPMLAGMTTAGDISMCVYEVVKKRYPDLDKKDGGVTVGKMNELLDELAGVRYPDQDPNIGSDQTAGEASSSVYSRGLQSSRKAWVRKLIAMNFSVS